MKSIVMVAVLVFVAGCAIVSQDIDDDKIAGVKMRMTQAEIQSLLGSPEAVSMVTVDGKEQELWFYPVERLWTKHHLNALNTAYYQIVFSDKKVVEWNRTSRYAQPSFKVVPNEEGQSQ